jgi:hypothetical protein
MHRSQTTNSEKVYALWPKRKVQLRLTRGLKGARRQLIKRFLLSTVAQRRESGPAMCLIFRTVKFAIRKWPPICSETQQAGSRLKLSTLGAARAEAIATEDGSAARRLEGDGITLTALVAGDFKTLTLAATAAAAPGTSAKLGAARISTIFASLRLAQVAFVVILLFALREGEGVPAISACNVNVWHGLLSPFESEAG